MFSPHDFAHLKIPLEDIRKATDNFSEHYVMEEHPYVTKYIGFFSQSSELIGICARRFKKEHENRNELFWTEVYMLSSLKHKNRVSIIGFCDENDEKIIIYKNPSRGSLSNYLSDPMKLTWVRRLEISVRLAKVLSCIYHNEPRDFSVIHRNINSDTVRINETWEPMLTDWELSLKIKASERHHSLFWDREGYADQTCLETNTLNHKSDIYSFGILLFELLCGRTSMIDDQDNKYLAPTAIFHYREKTLNDIIDPDLWKQMDQQSFNVFAKIAYDCLNEERSQRPNIDEIVARLESVLKLQMDPEHSIVAARVEDTSSNHGKGSFTSISTHIESHVSNKTKSFLKDLSHLKLRWENIHVVSNYFDVKGFKHGRIYKGRLLHSGQLIDVMVKWFDLYYAKNWSKEFWTELSMLSSLKHKNLVSLIGFSDASYTKIILYKIEANRSLNEYLSEQTLTWMQRLKICVGVAKALSYIHYDAGRDFSVIHCNISSSNILLDDKWEPKLSGFELSLKSAVAWRQHLLLTRDIIENVYLDPKYKKTGGVTHKSDVYSFGVVLLEVLCGRRAGKDEDEEGLLSQLEKSHLDDMVDPHLRKQMDPKSFRIFSDTTYYCLQVERAKRPYIDQVVKSLDKALELQWKHENPELPKNAVDGTSSNHLKWKNLEHLKIGLKDIELATENFADTYCIGKGGYGMVYKTQLEHFDSSKSSSIDGENKCDLPKKRSTVAIKCISR